VCGIFSFLSFWVRLNLGLEQANVVRVFVGAGERARALIELTGCLLLSVFSRQDEFVSCLLYRACAANLILQRGNTFICLSTQFAVRAGMGQKYCISREGGIFPWNVDSLWRGSKTVAYMKSRRGTKSRPTEHKAGRQIEASKYLM
jgi:hypothetical protein